MIKVILGVLILLLGASFYLLQNGVFEKALPEIVSNKITKEQAKEKVKALPEVQDFLKRVPNGKVEVNNELEGEYNIQVFEVKDGHTASFNWYRVSIKSGEVRPEF